MLKRQHKISIFIIIIFLANIFSAFAIDGFTSHPVYEGIDNAATQYQNLRFNDTANHWGREAIQEAGALSLMRGSNNGFQPDGNLTYLEALTVLVRAIGLEEEAQQFAETQALPSVRDFVILSVVEEWGRGYVQLAIQNNIITNQEANAITNLTQQQAENLQNQVQQRLDSYGENITPQERAALERQINQQLELNRWNRPISRQEIAMWIARALELQPLYGDKMVEVYSFNDWRQIDTDKIAYIEAVLQEGIMSGMGNGFVPNGNLTRAQMAQILMNIRDELLEKRGVSKLEGRVTKIEELQQQGQDKRIITIENRDNSYNLISLQPNKGKDILLQKNGILHLSDGFREGDRIQYFINQDNKAFYAKTIQATSTVVEGFVEFIDVENNRLAMVDFDDKQHLFVVHSNTPVTTNGKNVSFGELYYGQEVVVTLTNDRVTKIEGYLEEDPNLHGYIPPGSRIKVGDVLFINSQEVALKTGDGIEIYQITSDTDITRNSKFANLFEVKKGDRVILSFDDIYSAEISEIRVEDEERHITAIYRGTIEQVSERNKEVILEKVEVFENNRWVSHTESKVKLKAENNLYSGGSQITLKELSSAKGKEVYVATESSFGVQRVAKLLLKDGRTQQYDNKITNIQYGLGRMVVNNNSVNFHDGTIVVQNNRLIDPYNLEAQQTIHVTADFDARSNSRNAAFINIEYDGMLDDRIDGTRLLVYRGRIDTIGEYQVTIGRLAYQLDYLQLQDNTWVNMDRSKKISMTEDTYIFDSELELEIGVPYFMNSRYINPDDIKDAALRQRIKNRHYVGKTAYFVVKEYSNGSQTVEEILAISLTPHHRVITNRVNTDHGAIGEIASIDLDTNEITLTNLRHWNQLSKRWEAVTKNEAIHMDKAVILVNDQPLNRDEFYTLKKNAKVYVIKNKDVSTGDNAYVVIVEQ
ncbi:S-layer homology domain-containing protein [Alkaliphilus peptidifermentans]|uniref:S-layer homology domain-containing protein n=1 Tax=Alkaliphilus peptidifermentans DSM 18978 TaxID=1120976 RepID=A0A1G5AJ39_9FIRM|nr:S-layer homology domain-containing protein [Alkaliphilus peptidifermentans]SCX77862.1 S-layer homology domain-containing protein [Alkaliphilus peptidifermentans DSM 18978]